MNKIQEQLIAYEEDFQKIQDSFAQFVVAKGLQDEFIEFITRKADHDTIHFFIEQFLEVGANDGGDGNS